MYENIKSCVKISGESSQFFASNCGVRQGENLSPILFSIYLNDLENFLLSSNISSLDLETISNEINIYLRLLILLYADDTVIFSNNKENFQKALDSFFDYCELWKLNVNYSKTNVVIFNSRNNRNFTFNIGGNDILVTDKYKYLGVIFSKSGSFLNMRKHIIEQANKAMYLLFFRAKQSGPPH